MFVLSTDPVEFSDHPVRTLDWDTGLHVPPKVVGPSEKKLIIERLDFFANKLLTSGADMRTICETITKPLRPIWVTPQSKLHKGFSEAKYDFTSQGPPSEKVDAAPLTSTFLDEVDFFPIVCMSVSDPEKDGMPLSIELSDPHDSTSISASFVYVQGAADDEETWARGLAYTQFWDHYENFLSLVHSEAEIEKYIQTVVGMKLDEAKEVVRGLSKFDFIGTTNLAVGGWVSGKPPKCWEKFDIVINCTNSHHSGVDEATQTPPGKDYIMLSIPEGKKGQVQLSLALPKVVSWVREKANNFANNPPRILCHCAQGADRSVGVALTLLVEFMEDSGTFNFKKKRLQVNKGTIQRQLLFISQYRSQIRPSRATLKKVNDFFMSHF